jgi:hypothetical protein
VRRTWAGHYHWPGKTQQWLSSVEIFYELRNQGTRLTPPNASFILTL